LEGVGESKKILSGPELSRVHADAMDRVDSDRRALRSKDRILVEKEVKKDKSVEYSLRKDVPLCINHDRYGVLIRDQIIADAAASHWNDGAGEVMRAVLAASLAAADASPEAEATLGAPRTEPAVSVTRVQEYVNDARVLTRDIRLHKKSKTGDGSGVKTTPEYLQVMAGRDQSGEDTRAYLAVESHGSNTTYFVELQRVCVALRASLLKAIVEDRLGPDARRVLSVVMEAKLASEQTVRRGVTS
jgi:DNA-directed RNA polymerase III subunit RPC3